MNGLRPIMEDRPIKIISPPREETRLLPAPAAEKAVVAA
jgi:hypothetical protein